MKKFLGIVLVWTVVLGLGAAAYQRFLQRPDSPPSPELPAVRLALDSFSGYCVLRTPEYKKKLADQGLDFQWLDDKADYAQRMRTLMSGETPLAVFTIDALLAQTPHDGEPPAAIVLLIDETRGADAMISYTQGVADIDALNSAQAKIVLVENSPSETLVRVVRNQFDLPQLPRRKKDYLQGVASAEEVYTRFLASAPSERNAFVLWEPYVSKALKHPGAQLLVDSSRFKGFIVDVLVVQQAYLRQHPERVRMVVRTYLEQLHEHLQTPNGMANLVLADADRVGEKLNAEQAGQVANGIWWKNTVENYAHFGLLPADQAKGLQPLAEMIKNITTVLNQTKEPGEPDVGAARADKLVRDDPLQQLYGQRPPLHLAEQKLREEQAPPPPRTDDWAQLRRVGSFRVPPIRFARNKAILQDKAETQLTELANELNRWPRYYLRVEGNTLPQGDPDANRVLAEERAHAVKTYLVGQNVAEQRIRAVAMPPGQGREVRFVVFQAP